MITPSNRLPEGVADHVRRMFSGVDAVRVADVRWLLMDRGPDPVPIDAYSYRVVADVRGWSPSLHYAHLQFTYDLAEIADATPDPIERAKLLSDMQRTDRIGSTVLCGLASAAFAQDVIDQDALAAAARGRRIRKPLRMTAPGSVLNGQRLIIGHLVIDRSAAAMLRAQCDDPEDPCPRRTLEHAVATAHHHADDFDISVAVQDSIVDDVAVRMVEGRCLLDFGIAAASGLMMRGRTLSLPTVLPETTLAACEGRRVGEVVEAGPHLDDRIIETAYTLAGRTGLLLAEDAMSVDEAFPKAKSHRSTRWEGGKSH